MSQIKAVSHLLLHVEDLIRAEQFYAGVLGMTVKERGKLRDGRPLLVLQQGLGLTVFPQGAVPGGRTFDHLAFRVDDFDGFCTLLAAQQVKIVEGPLRNAYGRSLYLLDPEGNKIECHE